jgi:uncharacterized membrane protein YgdD (TMEM256/DUF423 family)
LLAISPLIIAFALVLPAFLIIGLPATALLAKVQRETMEACVGIGTVSGFLLTLLVLQLTSAQELVWMTPIGAFSGAMTGRTWWTAAREDKACYDRDFRDDDT